MHDARSLDVTTDDAAAVAAAGDFAARLLRLDQGVEAILDGRAIGQLEQTFAGDGLRCDFGSCGIVYRPDKLA